jgi:ssDNA-binding Zn-finger/Zn-ribbon topoisomerase 1
MGSIRCPKCGSRTAIRTAKKDDCAYHVCINYPRCGGRVLADEDEGGDWGDDLGGERPATKAAHDTPQQRVKAHPPKRGAKTTSRTTKKDSRKVRVGVNRPERKNRGSVDDTWSDDWDKEIPVPKPKVTPEKKEPPKPRPQMAYKKKGLPKPRLQIAYKKKGLPEPQRQIAPRVNAAPEKKRPSILVIVIALIVAFLAIDGMIYAAVILKDQETSTPTPTPTALSSDQDVTAVEYSL